MPRRRVSQQELFIKHHGKQIVSLGVLVWLVVMGQAVWQNIQHHSADFGQVMGVSIVKPTPIQLKKLPAPEQVKLIEYQNKLKLIVQDYLQKRAQFNQPHQDWIFLINNTRHKILKLDVPLVYKELHLKITMILDAEKEAVQNSDLETINQTSQQWAEVLKNFFWLNN